MNELPRQYLTLVAGSVLGDECQIIDRTTDLQVAIDNSTTWRARNPDYRQEIAIVEIKALISPSSP